ncbi:unnamed protein product [Tenebrio molitor]|nr:unnamed protein product [Tenebrio molitor]
MMQTIFIEITSARKWFSNVRARKRICFGLDLFNIRLCTDQSDKCKLSNFKCKGYFMRKCLSPFKRPVALSSVKSY